jgi:hypothetical protein
MASTTRPRSSREARAPGTVSLLVGVVLVAVGHLVADPV